jgi:predicted permease
VTLAGQQLTIVGVLPQSFKGTWLPTILTADVWLPVSASALLRTVQGTTTVTSHRTFAVIAPGASIEALDAAASTLGASLFEGRTDHAVLRAQPGARAIQLEDFAGPGRAIGTAVVGLSALVFLIACANLANLLLARGAARGPELAIRLVTGASRQRIFRLLLTETVLLTVIAAVVSLALIEGMTHGLQAIPLPAVQGMHMSFDISPDYRVFGFALLIAAVASMAIGTIPAWRASRTQPVAAIRSGGSGAATRRKTRLQSALVGAQIALSLVLLLGAGLYARSAIKARQLDPGFDLAHGAMVSFDLALHKIDEPRGRRIFDRLLEAARAVPGVESAVLMSALPAGGPAGTNSESTSDLLPEGQAPGIDTGGRGSGWYARYVQTTPGAFHTIGVALRAGRDFTDADALGAPAVVIVSESLAQKFWTLHSAIGRRITLVEGGPLLEIVGIAADTTAGLVGRTDPMFAYVPLAQQYNGQVHVVVRAWVPPATVVAPLAQALSNAEPDVAFFDERTVADTVGLTLVPIKLAAIVLGGLGLLGLAISSLGLYGVVSYIVSQRTREFGIRKALGATTMGIHGEVLRHGLWMLTPGLIVGVALAFLGANLLRSLLFGIGAHDPLTFVGVPAALLIVGIVASLVPARRASRVDPNVALRDL